VAALSGASQSYERKANAMSTESTMEGGADALAGNGYDTDHNSADFIVRNSRDPQNAASAHEP
jgi:hypothetical protein